ncbi:hypothetical protein A7982_13655 [Minicystis rosea]|nr:hypothetical protein A7982_13655 [Minicystis rosea]
MGIGTRLGALRLVSPQVTEVDTFCAALDASVAWMSHPRWCG